MSFILTLLCVPGLTLIYFSCFAGKFLLFSHFYWKYTGVDESCCLCIFAIIRLIPLHEFVSDFCSYSILVASCVWHNSRQLLCHFHCFFSNHPHMFSVLQPTIGCTPIYRACVFSGIYSAFSGNNSALKIFRSVINTSVLYTKFQVCRSVSVCGRGVPLQLFIIK